MAKGRDKLLTATAAAAALGLACAFGAESAQAGVVVDPSAAGLNPGTTDPFGPETQANINSNSSVTFTPATAGGHITADGSTPNLVQFSETGAYVITGFVPDTAQSATGVIANYSLFGTFTAHGTGVLTSTANGSTLVFNGNSIHDFTVTLAGQNGNNPVTLTPNSPTLTGVNAATQKTIGEGFFVSGQTSTIFHGPTFLGQDFANIAATTNFLGCTAVGKLSNGASSSFCTTAGAGFFQSPLDGIGLDFLIAVTENAATGTFPVDTSTPDQIIVALNGVNGPITFEVPEPASLALFGFGLVGLAGLRRKFSA
jgi:hypothetical protein